MCNRSTTVADVRICLAKSCNRSWNDDLSHPTLQKDVSLVRCTVESDSSVTDVSDLRWQGQLVQRFKNAGMRNAVQL
jgi:hypothetical protein